ncbi:cysteine-rich small domain-containing protein [Plebeiibacterium marinum]|uniref:Cysteine-rich small domain-containing protein n=1 Tax=Plebeiibacterium marinum TaxID=2992111 RepID=A0AAE3MFC8_9BACT|nr:cysteine-rich small domain-containing protein [Plebeiobacterium marinum]MCW3806818.1 cysteine-rich small domain-containing protein [Plebeiobacterium marinum]
MKSVIETENYKFVQNRKCEFFPCHKIKNEDDFNCLFCFCPLYMLKDKCGGNFKYTNGKKDCSDCKIPHSKGAYEHVMSKMDLVMEIGSKRD